MKKLIPLLICPRCKSAFRDLGDQGLVCSSCGYQVKKHHGVFLFDQNPMDMQPFDKRERGREKGTPWRQANWHFLEQQVEKLPSNALMLDVGCGHGDFSEILSQRDCIFLDVMPYPEANIACDLTKTMPFRENAFDAVALMNVLEHVYESQKLLDRLKFLLRPGGVILITIPFLLKIHQAPYDFHRYSHFALHHMAQELGFEVEMLEGYYDAAFLLGEGIRNIQFYALTNRPRLIHWAARFVLEAMKFGNRLNRALLGKGIIAAPASQNSPAPIGYHVVLRKPENKK
jgi:SAM-dependent methyltransferase